MRRESEAWEEESVSLLYQDMDVAESYIQERFSFSWNRLLHQNQIAEINLAIRKYQPKEILELAPGPARIATDLRGVQKGLMVEFSEEMLAVARQRLKCAGLDSVWKVRQGNAFDLGSLSDQYDFLYTFRFIRHFKTEERERLYRSISSRLNSGGILMFDVVNRSVREKLDAKRKVKEDGSLNVYDVTYSQKDFRKEMQKYGFKVISLKPVLSYFKLQTWISYTFDRRVPKLSEFIVRLFDKVPSSSPLEWIALCQKIH